MSLAAFSFNFSDEFAGLLTDDENPTPLVGPQLVLTPKGFVSNEPTQPIAFATFSDLRDNYEYPTFDALAEQVEYPTFDDIMRGHPGFPGGPQKLPSGSGMILGYEYGGVQWWITEVEGVEDSAQWEGAVVNPASMDGSWSAGVLGVGREITISATLAADGPEELAAAKNTATAALAVAPHQGWLRYGDRRISVQLDGPIRVKSRGSQTADIQVKLRGIDLGTPGVGAHFEDANGAQTYNLVWGLDDQVVVGGTVPSPPFIEVIGPVPPQTVVVAGNSGFMLPNGIPHGSIATIDSRRRRVLLDTLPQMSLVQLSDWPLMTVGANRLFANTQDGSVPTGLVRVSVTALY